MAAWLKHQNPAIKIYFLARSYVKDIVARCPYIDEFIDWAELSKQTDKPIIKYFSSLNIDAFINVFPIRRIAKLAKQSGVPQCIGTSKRWYNWLYCNKRVSFTRKNSNLHEAQLNFELLRPLGLTELPKLSWLSSLKLFNIPDQKKLSAQKHLDPQRFTLILHPLSNGNGREWPLDHFVELANCLNPEKYQILVTGSESEGEHLQVPLFNKCNNIENYCGKLSLAELLDVIAVVDGVVVSSTGPLHLAAACGTCTLGLFPKMQGIDAKRWGPLGQKAEYIVAEEPCPGCTNSVDCLCMQRLRAAQVIPILERWRADK